ncbi:putative Late nodulin [Medicago truncatula]|uniref:Putative Late nodulin n=1 Tax=Medicago truncatula TaxID=3880 RepID=A0A396GZA8_MEDTR|nr:putative Late nodulin [Medicago truncatula]
MQRGESMAKIVMLVFVMIIFIFPFVVATSSQLFGVCFEDLDCMFWTCAPLTNPKCGFFDGIGWRGEQPGECYCI